MGFGDGDLLAPNYYKQQQESISVKTGNFTVDPVTGIFTSTSHGLVNNDVIRKSSSGSLPTKLSSSKDYYTEIIDNDTYYIHEQASDEKGNFNSSNRVIPTDTGSGTHSFTWQSHEYPFENEGNSLFIHNEDNVSSIEVILRDKDGWNLLGQGKQLKPDAAITYPYRYRRVRIATSSTNPVTFHIDFSRLESSL